MQDRHSIPYEHWTLKVGRQSPQGDPVPPFFGEIVYGVDALEQSIRALILTPKGSVPTEPEKGCDLMPYLDRSAEIAIPNITQAIWDALTIWEPRIVTQDIRVLENSFSTLEVEIHWRPIESVLDDLRVTQVSLPLSSASDRRVA